MKKKQKTMSVYEAPKVEVVEVEIEKGFAVSVYVNVNAWEDGGNLGNGEFL